jgi:hypothetical protein
MKGVPVVIPFKEITRLLISMIVCNLCVKKLALLLRFFENSWQT